MRPAFHDGQGQHGQRDRHAARPDGYQRDRDSGDDKLQGKHP
jgi:hypothetical protein